MRGLIIGFFSLALYVFFLTSTFFTTSMAGESTGEIDPIILESKIDSVSIPAGNYSEVNRPPVYVGIGPGGPPNHVIKLQTGIIRTQVTHSIP